MSADSTKLPQDALKEEIIAVLRHEGVSHASCEGVADVIMRGLKAHGFTAEQSKDEHKPCLTAGVHSERACPCKDTCECHPSADTFQANDDALKRGMLVCPTCNDHHDEESVCRACADLEVTLARHREVTGMALARLRSALLKRGVNVTLDHAQSILDYAINGDGVG